MRVWQGDRRVTVLSVVVPAVLALSLAGCDVLLPRPSAILTQAPMPPDARVHLPRFADGWEVADSAAGDGGVVMPVVLRGVAGPAETEVLVGAGCVAGSGQVVATTGDGTTDPRTWIDIATCPDAGSGIVGFSVRPGRPFEVTVSLVDAPASAAWIVAVARRAP